MVLRLQLPDQALTGRCKLTAMTQKKNTFPYELKELIGKGGMGSVYRAFDPKSNQDVAFKTLIAQKDATQWSDGARRLKDEALAAAVIQSPYLVRCLDGGEHPELGPYIVYELLEGKNLRDELDSKAKVSPQKALKTVIEPLLLGLAALHDKHIIHRDIKPENMLFRRDGICAIGDLGLAHFDGREAKTVTGLIVGTPGYVAPERLLQTKKETTPAADIYSAALVIIETLTGHLPFSSVNPVALVHEQLSAKVSASKLAKMGLSPAAAQVLASALSNNPEERPEAKELMAELSKSPLMQAVPKVNTAKPYWLLILLLLIPIYFLWPAKKLSEKTQTDFQLAFQEIRDSLKTLSAREQPPSPKTIKLLIDKVHRLPQETARQRQEEWLSCLAEVSSESIPWYLAKALANENLCSEKEAKKYWLETERETKLWTKREKKEFGLQTTLFLLRHNHSKKPTREAIERSYGFINSLEMPLCMSKYTQMYLAQLAVF